MSYMSVSYTLRLPNDLKRLLDQERMKTGQSMASIVVSACWLYVDKGEDDAIRDDTHEGEQVSNRVSRDTRKRERVESLRNIVGNIQSSPAGVGHRRIEVPVGDSEDSRSYIQPVDPCPRTGFNEQDGETYGCSLAKGHRPPCRPGKRV